MKTYCSTKASRTNAVAISSTYSSNPQRITINAANTYKVPHLNLREENPHRKMNRGCFRHRKVILYIYIYIYSWGNMEVIWRN